MCSIAIHGFRGAGAYIDPKTGARQAAVAFGTPNISFIGYPVSVPCAGHAGLGFREARPADKAAILSHLLGLTPEDRHLRFCGSLSGEALAAHVATLPAAPGFALTAHDGPLWDGPFHRAGPVRAFAELIVSGKVAELGISVDRGRRRAGVGTYMVQTAARLLALRGVEEIVALTLARNTAMVRLGLGCGARIEQDGPDVTITFSVSRLHAAYLARRAAQVFTRAHWGG
jgi:GNAT superfamily N-acetyltransferase